MELTLVGLPLGNIADISLRAIETLKGAKHLICEDTRVFRRLWLKLASLGLVAGEFGGQLYVLNDFNERREAERLLAQLSGQEVVLVSDAGMPVVSDPGYRLVKAAREAGWTVTAVPGPTAATTALALSGLPPDLVVLAGFLPKKTGKFKEKLSLLNNFADQGATVIFYESPYRLVKLLAGIKEIFASGTIVIGRELTKSHQQLVQFDLATESLPNSFPLKGEFVVLVSKKQA